MDLDPNAKETKLFNAIVDLLDDLSLSVEEMEDAYDELSGQVDEILFLQLGAAAGRDVPGPQTFGVDAVGGEELDLACVQQGSHRIGHPIVLPIVKAAAPCGQRQNRHTGGAVDLELHLAAEHPAPLFVIGTLHHGSNLLNLYELISRGVVLIPGGSKLCAQCGLIFIQIVAQCVEGGVKIAQLQVHHAQQHDGVIGQYHAKTSSRITKKPATRQSDRQMQLLRQRG